MRGGLERVPGVSDTRTARARVAAQVHMGPAVEKEVTGHSVRVTTGDGRGQVRTGMWEMCHRVRPPAARRHRRARAHSA
ncbi:hypothetical protein SNE510_59300 [Streptomyces sp. NE5-10]|nr:hypothetical protein SNE510_59300 [Streptomyces sp. NE5-10]